MSAPAAGTVTATRLVPPKESLITRVVDPEDSPVMESSDPVTVALAIAGLLLFTR